jgi:ribonuclease E
MEAAFVDIGRGRNAVLYAGEVDWDAAGLAGKARRIEQALSSGDNILVQVTKDPVGHKGARLTTQISLPGRFLVYVPSGGTHGISRKLPDVERRRLKDLLKEIVPEDAGVIIRTASEGVSQEALERDVRRLQAQWDVVKTKADAATSAKGKSKAPDLLYEEPDLMIKVVRDQFNEDFAKLVVEGDDAWDTLQAYISHVAPELMERVHRHVGTSDVFTEFRVDEQLTKALDRKVWLPSGGTLVIDRTEAMTVIDVNTGKFTGSGGNLEETVTRNNLEAAEEIVRQLRLRDIGGIIVIDFIDMVLESNRDLVLRRLTECLGRDRTRHQVAEVTSLGLVQMTRKRVGVGLLEAFSTPCEHCRGRGVMVSSDPVEQRVDLGQHGSHGSGRRRGRGGDHDNGGNGRRRGGSGGSGGEAPDGREQPAPAVASPNGKPAPTPAVPAPPAPAPAVPPPPPVPAASETSASSPASPGLAVPPPDREPVTVGGPAAETPRPARRRRRVASRPAGPPVDEGADADHAGAGATEPGRPDPV